MFSHIPLLLSVFFVCGSTYHHRPHWFNGDSVPRVVPENDDDVNRSREVAGDFDADRQLKSVFSGLNLNPSSTAGSRALADQMFQDEVATGIVNEYLLHLRLYIQAHEKENIADQFLEGFVFRTCEKDVWVHQRDAVVEFLNQQENIITRPFTVSRARRHPLNFAVSFNLQFPSLFNGTVFVNLIPMNNKFVAASSFKQC